MGKLLYVWVRETILWYRLFHAKAQRLHKDAKKIFRITLRLCVTFVPLRETLLRRSEPFGHADEVGEGIGAHFLHNLAAMEFDCDLARA